MVLLALLGMVLFVRLGVWQLGRADEKEALLAAYAAGGSQMLNLDDSQVARFSRVEIQGVWDAGHVFLLDNMVFETQAGFHVLVPLITRNTTILVDLGWVPSSGRRDQLPSLRRLPDQSVVLRGRLDRLPQPGIRLEGGAVESSAPWPRVVVFPTLADIEAQLGATLFPWILRIDEKEPWAYQVRQQVVKFGPERHVGYAVQWFALAGAVLVIFLVVNTKKVLREPTN